MPVADTSNALTLARRSVWTAIDNYSSLAGKFTTKLKFDAADSSLLDGFDNDGPSLGDLPLIQIRPERIDPEWEVNKKQIWLYGLRIDIYVGDWYLPDAETLITQAVEAVFRYTADGDTAPIVTKTVGRIPQLIGPIGLELTRLNDSDDGEGTKVIRASAIIGLGISKNPFGG